MIGDAAADAGGLYFADPATTEEIRTLEQKLKTKFPKQFYEIYTDFDGVGLKYDDGEIIWWLLPLSKIEDGTEGLRDSWTDDPKSEALADKLIIFGDWYNGDVFGYRRSKSGAIKSTRIYQYEHEVGRIDRLDSSLDKLLRG